VSMPKIASTRSRHERSGSVVPHERAWADTVDDSRLHADVARERLACAVPEEIGAADRIGEAAQRDLGALPHLGVRLSRALDARAQIACVDPVSKVKADAGKIQRDEEDERRRGSGSPESPP